ncbi:MAG: GTP pyrophosphokinase [Fusobacteriaceae bacterium]
MKKSKYEKLISAYDDMGLDIIEILNRELKEQNIPYMQINKRIKSYNSLNEKLEKKLSIKNINDICGVRIICFYSSDISSIEKIIRENFEITEQINKEEELGTEKFGYRSNHYIIKFNKEWLSLGYYKKYKNKNVEIQVRTILMHAWADISHKLSYKKDQISSEFTRKLNQLSALFEIADERFVNLKDIREKNIFREDSNIENIISIHFSDRKEPTSLVLEYFSKELNEYKISIKTFSKYIKEITKNDLIKFERLINGSFVNDQIGMARLALYIRNSKFYNSQKNFYKKLYGDKKYIRIEKLRDSINKKINLNKTLK